MDATDNNEKNDTYYGYIEEIWEFYYGPNFKVLSVKTHRRVATGNTKSREVAKALAGPASSDNGPQSSTCRRFRRM
jgi:hypothetical protein